MKKILLLLVLISNTIVAQRVSTTEVIRVSDSILTSHVGIDMKPYFEVSAGSYYTYPIGNKITTTGKFLKRKKLKRKATEIKVLYSFNYRKIDGVRGGVWVTLDKNLHLISIGDLNFIPEFLKTNSESNFISKNEAEKNAVKFFKEKSVDNVEVQFVYSQELKKYTYCVFNKFTKVKNQAGQDAGETEIVEIDAVSGEVLEIRKGLYGLIIR